MPEQTITLTLSSDTLAAMRAMLPPDFTHVLFYTDDQLNIYKAIGLDAADLGLTDDDFDAGHDSRADLIAQHDAYNLKANEARELKTRGPRRAARIEEIQPLLDQLDAANAKYSIEFYDKDVPEDHEFGDDKPTPKLGKDIPRVVLDGKRVRLTAPLINATGVEIVNDNFEMTEDKGR